MKKVVEIYEKRQKRRQWIGLFERGARRPVIEERYAEVEVWERLCCKSFEEDIDDHIGIEEIRVELVELQDSQVSKAVILLAANLVVEVILENTDI